jgi:hypothetical protein
MTKYASWPSTDQGNIVGSRLANELYHRFGGGLNALGFDGQKDAALAELLATTGEVFNVKSFGAKGDGVTDDRAAIQAAIDAASLLEGKQGTTIVFPAGVFLINSQLFLKDRVRLLGVGVRSSNIKADSTFADPYMFVAANGGVSMFGSILEKLDINCNGVSGLGGIVSDAWQENSGLRDVLIRGWTTYGVHIRAGDGGASSLLFENAEIFAAAGATSGILVDQISLVGGFKLSLRNVVVAGATGSLLAKGIDVAGDSILADNLHFEDCVIGIELDGVGHSAIRGISGSATGPVTTVVEIASGFSGDIHIDAIHRWGATNAIVNNVNSETITRDLASYDYPYGHSPNQAKAFVTFDGSGGSILESAGGISSVTRHGTGDYQVFVDDPFVDVNYAYFVNLTPNTGGRITLYAESFKSPGGVRFQTYEWIGGSSDAASLIDPTRVHVVFYSAVLDRNP